MDLEDRITQSKHPEDCKQGEQARLVPVMDWKETHLLGFFLAAFQAIPTFSSSVFALIDSPKRKIQRVDCYTEVVFKSDKDGKNRCDGLIEITSGKTTSWRAIVEAKMGASKIDGDQIERYLRLARENKIDAVLTISNDFVTKPTDSLVKVSGHLTRSVKLFHLSWWSLVTEALLIRHNDNDLATSEKFLLDELLRACLHPKAKIQGFTQMSKAWKDVVSKAHAGTLTKSDPETQAIVSDWMQEQKELALILSRFLGKKAAVWLPSRHRDPNELRKALTNTLVQTNKLSCEIRLDDIAAPIRVSTEVANRRHKFSMELEAPKDRKSSKARLNWLLRQLAKAKDERIEIACLWPGSTKPNPRPLKTVVADPDEFLSYRAESVPHGFEVSLIDDLEGQYQRSKVFIERLEKSYLVFYDEVVKRLRVWQPSAPKPVQVPEVQHEAEHDA